MTTLGEPLGERVVGLLLRVAVGVLLGALVGVGGRVRLGLPVSVPATPGGGGGGLTADGVEDAVGEVDAPGVPDGVVVTAGDAVTVV